MKRRDFLNFMGRTTGAGILSFSLGSWPARVLAMSKKPSSLWPSLTPQSRDEVVTVPELHHQVVVSWQDAISKTERFGFNNDFLALLPGPAEGEFLLWSNHESVHPIFVSDYNPGLRPGVRKTREQVDKEQKDVGGSFVHIKKSGEAWQVVKDSSHAFRVDATTPMKLISARSIQDKKTAIGTTANCCGGKTPWGTILTCEENFDDFYGQVRFSKKPDGSVKRHVIAASAPVAWDDHTPHPPEHYGWVVEVNPKTRECKKLVAMGRFAHEGALVLQAADGRSVVYMGDDSAGEHFYKFIAKKPGSLEEGDLYVANLESGKWEHLSVKNPLLKNHFKDQTELLIRTREAAKIVGATALDRPEACARDPISKNIFLACTMNKSAGRPYGSIRKFYEQDLLSLQCKSDVFLDCGPELGIACPDNLIFDSKGNLWITNDIADYDLMSEGYKEFGHNALFFIPMSGADAGRAFRIATAPKEAEFTGPCFSPDGKSLFLSVQHPGANSNSLQELTSHWPGGGSSVPRPSVIALSGPLFDQILKM